MNKKRRIELLANRVCSNLSRKYRWPKGSMRNLQEAVRQSTFNYVVFWERVDKWDRPLNIRTKGMGMLDLEYDGPDWLRPVVEFYEQLEAGGIIAPPDVFVTKWFERVHQDVSKWAAWSGRFDQFVFHEGHPMFHAMGFDCAQRYGKEKLWNRFLFELTRNENKGE